MAAQADLLAGGQQCSLFEEEGGDLDEIAREDAFVRPSHCRIRVRQTQNFPQYQQNIVQQRTASRCAEDVSVKRICGLRMSNL